MRILFIHQNFPAQYRYIAAHLARAGTHSLVAVAKKTAGRVRGVKRVLYDVGDMPSRSRNPYLTSFETKVQHGAMVRDSLVTLRSRGYTPDVILAHPGWGEALFVRDVFPQVPRLDYCEFYYAIKGADVNFDPEQPPVTDGAAIRGRNMSALSSLESCDWGVSPTHWQSSRYPEIFRDKISVIHDGIDTARVRPDPNAALTLADGTTLSAADEVVTFVARHLEPYRGFHQFMRAVPLILEQRPQARIVVIGADGFSYGRPAAGEKSLRERLLDELGLTSDRLHFLGKVDYDRYLSALQISSAHVYLTVPFVLSWSLLEAMAAGAPIIASDTPPVAEVIVDGHNGLLVDFFSPQQIALRVSEMIEGTVPRDALCAAARATIEERFALRRCLPAQLRLIEHVAAGRRPPGAKSGGGGAGFGSVDGPAPGGAPQKAT